jgi:hypothetical protein
MNNIDKIAEVSFFKIELSIIRLAKAKNYKEFESIVEIYKSRILSEGFYGSLFKIIVQIEDLKLVNIMLDKIYNENKNEADYLFSGIIPALNLNNIKLADIIFEKRLIKKESFWYKLSHVFNNNDTDAVTMMFEKSIEDGNLKIAKALMRYNLIDFNDRDIRKIYYTACGCYMNYSNISVVRLFLAFDLPESYFDSESIILNSNILIIKLLMKDSRFTISDHTYYKINHRYNYHILCKFNKIFDILKDEDVEGSIEAILSLMDNMSNWIQGDMHNQAEKIYTHIFKHPIILNNIKQRGFQCVSKLERHYSCYDFYHELKSQFEVKSS